MSNDDTASSGPASGAVPPSPTGIAKALAKSEVAVSVVAYSFCSGSLVLINKLILHSLPYPSLVISFQLAAAVLFIVTASRCGFIECDGLRWKYILPYSAYIVAFSLGVYCNMKSLQLSNVETVIVFRALAPCIVSMLDVLFLGREFPTARSWAGLSLLVIGAYGYAVADPEFQTQGSKAYLWPTLYLVVISFEMAYGKKLISTVDLKTKSGPVLYTNLLGLPPMLMFAAMGNEPNRLWDNMWDEDNLRFPRGSIILLLVGCVVGTCIGYSSWWCRDKVSATSFTLIGVMNKCLTVLVNLLIWDNHASPMGIGSLFVCLLGGVLYKQAPMKGAKPSTSPAALPVNTESVSGKQRNGWDTEVGAVDGASEQEIEPLSGEVKRRG